MSTNPQEPPPGAPTPRQFLADEFREAWQHYRHCENDRTVSLGFMFTIALTAMAWIGTTLATGWTSSAATQATPGCHPDTCFLTHCIAFLIGLLGVVVFLRISHTSVVLNYYHRAWNYLREQIYGKSLFDELRPK